jgi:Trk-type K+ transport system membrane component
MMGYVLTALVVVVGLASMLIGVAASSAVGSITLVIYLAVAALYYMPIERLNRFVKGCSMALETGDERALIEGLYGLSRAMRMLVIYTVVVFAIYAVIFLFALVFGLSSSLIGA